MANKLIRRLDMANCIYCGEVITRRNDNGRNQVFCDKSHEQLWRGENRGNTFTAFSGDTPDIVESRKQRYKIWQKAVAGCKESRKWLKKNLRLLAIYDKDKQEEIRL
jgi:hypothetical protein